MPSKKWVLFGLAVFGALALANYFPVVRGEIPFPSHIIQRFPPWHDEAPPASVQQPHAELGDLVTMFYPWRTFAAAAIRHGKLPLWNPHILAGAPFLANGQSAVFYPVNFLYYLLPVRTAWPLRLMLQIVLAGCMMALFVRAIGGSPF